MKVPRPCRLAQTPLFLFPTTDLTSWTVRSRCATKRQMQPTSSHMQPGSAVVQQTGCAKPEELERFNTAEHSRLPWPSPRSRVDPIGRARQDGLSQCTTLCDIGEDRTISNQSKLLVKHPALERGLGGGCLSLVPRGTRRRIVRRRNLLGWEKKKKEVKHNRKHYEISVLGKGNKKM